MTSSTPTLRRRRLAVFGVIAAGGLALTACSGGASSESTGTAAPEGSGEVFISTPGGSYEEAWKTACWDPFTEETGIEVVSTPVETAAMAAQHEAGAVTLDIADIGDFQLMGLQADAPVFIELDYDKFTRTDLDDLQLVEDVYVGNSSYATVIAYNTETFPDTHPTTWEEFWDVEAFPATRTLVDRSAGIVNVAQASLSGGTSVEDVYPVDLDLAFEQFTAIKPDITTYYTSGSQLADLFSNGTIELGSAWNGRIQALIDDGAPLAIEWNEAELHSQGYGILDGAPNEDNAYALIDYCLQPEVQAEYAALSGYGPLNTAAYEFISDDVAERLPGAPRDGVEYFFQDPEWWVDNMDEVTERWTEFLLQ
jgi:putative spermidine/putrescine transport system substrate-binding protein